MATDDFIEPEITSFSWTTKEAERVPMSGDQACWLLNDAVDFARGVEAISDILMSHELRRGDRPIIDVNKWESLVLLLRLTGRVMNDKWSDQAMRMCVAGETSDA